MKCFQRPPKFVNRLIMVILGVIVQGFGLSLLINISLGTDPCTAFTQGIIEYVPLSFGTAQLLINLFAFIFVVKYDLSQVGYGTIANMVFIGYISDFFRYIWSNILPENFFEPMTMKLIILIPALIIFILGASAYMTAGLGASPYDALPFIISAHVNKISFKYLRMIWDISFMAIGLILGGNVGIMTIALAFFLGPVITWTKKKLSKFIE